MHRHVLHHVLRRSARVGVLATLIEVLGGVGAIQDGTEAAVATPASLMSAPTVSAPVASVPTAPLAEAKEQHERLVGGFWQGAVGKGVSNPGWNAWLNMHGPPPREQDTDKDPVVNALIGEAYDDWSQDRTLRTIKGCNVPEHHLVWRERVEALDSAGQLVACKSDMLSGALPVDGSTVTGTWSDDSRNQPFTLKRVTRYHEFTGTFSQARLTERYPVTGDAAVDALVQSLRVRKCDKYGAEYVIRISAVDLGDTVSLLRMVWAHSGGAHGNYSFTADNR